MDDNGKQRLSPEKPSPVGTRLSPQTPAKRFKISVSPVSLPDIPENDAKHEDVLKDPDLSKTTEDKSMISSSLTETSAIKEYHNNGGFLRLRSIENAFDDFTVEESGMKSGAGFDDGYVD